jgi:hypothetical protein
MYRVGNGITPPSRRILAVLVDQQLRRAEDVGVVDHSAGANGSMQRGSLLAGLFTRVLTG